MVSLDHPRSRLALRCAPSAYPTFSVHRVTYQYFTSLTSFPMSCYFPAADASSAVPELDGDFPTFLTPAQKKKLKQQQKKEIYVKTVQVPPSIPKFKHFPFSCFQEKLPAPTGSQKSTLTCQDMSYRSHSWDNVQPESVGALREPSATVST